MLSYPAPAIRRRYDRLIKEVDSQIEGLRRFLGPRLNCRPGCAACCQPFSVFALEAALIVGRMAKLAANQAQPSAPGVCVFLDNDLCRIYAIRPLICRSQGLPLAYADLERQCLEVSACPINFPEETEFAVEELLFLDAANRRLAALNIEYCRQYRLDAG
ncbi:MAG TPA: hypothetical protein DEB25_06665, partial [Desulfobulbaceae bacterium]|nr:hypothetical protein [Desulfobulbaceae bacterium]